MRTIILTCCLFVTQLSSVEPNPSKQQKSLFEYTESESLGNQLRCLYDLIVFQDGTQCCGVLERIPSLSYPFGTVTIPIDQVRLISAGSHRLGEVKLFTSNGNVYVASMADQEISFDEYLSEAATSRRSERRTITSDEVSFILIRTRGIPPVDPPDPLFVVTFTNGNIIPVQLNDPAILLSDRWNRYSISPGDIIDVSFNGGLYGRVLNKEGEESNLAPAFVYNSSFTAIHPSHRGPLHLLWKDVSRIQRVDRHTDPQYQHSGNMGLIETAEWEPRVHPEISGVSVELVEFPEEIEDLTPLFNEENAFDIPFEVVFIEEEPEPLLQVNPDLIEREDFFAVIEDFDLDEWEKKEQDDDQEKTQEDSDEFIFTSEGSAMKAPFFYQIEEKNLIPIKQVVCVKKGPEQKPPLPLAPAQQEELDGMVYVAAKHPYSRGFFIRPKKISNREYSRFVQALNYKTPNYWVQGKIPTGTEDDPVVDISYKDAFLFAVWSGKRLPRKEELRLASRESSFMMDLEDELYEWTQTPSQGSTTSLPEETTPQQSGEGTFPSAHFVYGLRREVPMLNNSHNSYTGFRLALDAR